ncbi:helix-turn-helix domain-containing protein [Flavobacterium sp. Sr18]|uniref:helix-turn-helix domain-containing protein n=1 Tax=Flavobacterium sp. Sr18 TaxID=935222 RepID=UPI0013E4B8DA|nr:helix-turn-helix domain-containing protein [Flavobacterium sp. Sr18]QIH39734.1 helix-turn-helix domain-containing protein [Flavobacterium sp. Sr18]
MSNPFEVIDARLSNIESLLLDIKHPPKQKIIDGEVLLDEDEACAFLKTNSVTLWRWVKAGKIKVYKFSHKNYYKRNEILETITPLKK